MTHSESTGAGPHVRLPYGNHEPTVAQTAFIAPNATLIGDVEVRDGAGVFYGAVAHAHALANGAGVAGVGMDRHVVLEIRVRTQSQWGAITTHHGAVVHGCTLEDEVLVGMNATVLNGAVIGTGSLIAAGAVVLEGTRVPPGSLVAGVPGKVRRELTEDERTAVRQNAEHYMELSREHRKINGQ